MDIKDLNILSLTEVARSLYMDVPDVKQAIDDYLERAKLLGDKDVQQIVVGDAVAGKYETLLEVLQTHNNPLYKELNKMEQFPELADRELAERVATIFGCEL